MTDSLHQKSDNPALGSKEAPFRVNSAPLSIPNESPEWFTFQLPEIQNPDNAAVITQLEGKYEINALYQKMRSVQ